MGSQPPVFPFHPEFFQVKRHRQKEQLCPDILFSTGQKSSEPEVCFEQRKCSLHLDGTAYTQIDPSLSGNVRLRSCPLFQEGLFQSNLFWFFCILRMAAGAAPGTVFATLTSVMSRGHKVSIHKLGGFSSEGQLSTFCTGKIVFFLVIGHILNAANLLPELLCFLCFVIGRLNETDLSVFFQKQIVLQAFVSGICSYFFIFGLVVLPQLFQERTRVPMSVRLGNTSTPVIYSLFTAIWTLYAGFSCPLRIWSSFIRMNVASGSVLA